MNRLDRAARRRLEVSGYVASKSSEDDWHKENSGKTTQSSSEDFSQIVAGDFESPAAASCPALSHWHWPGSPIGGRRSHDGHASSSWAVVGALAVVPRPSRVREMNLVIDVN